MNKIPVLLLFFSMIFFQTLPQKYIKYVFLDNQVKITIPVKFEKKDPKEYQDKEVLKILKVWQTKGKDAILFAFEGNMVVTGDICDQLRQYLEKLADYTAEKSVRSNKKQFINDRQEICVMEITESGNNPDKKYMVVFGGKIKENQNIIFVFLCPEGKKKHYQPVINGIIKTLTLN